MSTELRQITDQDTIGSITDDLFDDLVNTRLTFGRDDSGDWYAAVRTRPNGAHTIERYYLVAGATLYDQLESVAAVAETPTPEDPT